MSKKSKEKRRKPGRDLADHKGKIKDNDKDWDTPCENCDQVPTVHPTGLCGPCCFGEAETAGGNW